jgi:Uma2 family endonuclease
MKAVMASVPEFILEWRRKTGADRRDEMWEGVLHMSPEADREHQDLEGCLEGWLRQHWARPRRAKVYHRINISTAEVGNQWTDNFRIPDLVLLTRDRFHIDRKTYFAGGPNVVVEIRSPNDESEEKLPFYASIGILEVWIIDRDTKQTDLYVLEKGTYRLRSADTDGWTRSPFTGVEFRIGRPGKLAIRLNGDEATRDELPED